MTDEQFSMGSAGSTFDPADGNPVPTPPPTVVYQPDNPSPAPQKRGSWDDILPQSGEPKIKFAEPDGLGVGGNPADNQPLPAKLHDLSTTLRSRPTEETTDTPQTEGITKQADTSEPVVAKTDEPHGMFDDLDQPEQAHPQIITRQADPAPAIAVVPEPTAAPAPTTDAHLTTDFSVTTGDDGSLPADWREQELEDTFAARFARYGKTAVTALALPFLSSGRLTKNILKNGLRTGSAADAAEQRAVSSEQWGAAELQTLAPPTLAGSGSVVKQIMNMYGVSRHEALTKIREAVTKANQTAGTEVARILDHDPTIETDDEVGVYIEVEGGRALSLNADDVMRVLGKFI